MLCVHECIPGTRIRICTAVCVCRRDTRLGYTEIEWSTRGWVCGWEGGWVCGLVGGGGCVAVWLCGCVAVCVCVCVSVCVCVCVCSCVCMRASCVCAECMIDHVCLCLCLCGSYRGSKHSVFLLSRGLRPVCRPPPPPPPIYFILHCDVMWLDSTALGWTELGWTGLGWAGVSPPTPPRSLVSAH
jgi:hypothetical protein